MSANSLLVVGLLMPVLLAPQGVVAADQPDSSRRHRLAEVSVNAITLVNVGDGVAVIRENANAMEVVRVGDLIGKTKAIVNEISGGRLVLDETFIDKDGKPNRALIVIKAGERGGTRFLQRAGEPAFTGSKPTVVIPAAPVPAKPAPKKPPQM